MIPESIHPTMKVGHIRKGDAKVFGEDSDVRRKLGDEAAIARFNELWSSKLSAEVERAGEITREQAEELLEGKPKGYAVSGYTFRQFSLHNVLFIARLTPAGYCDQLWSLGTHRDRTRLCVYFDTIVDRERFEDIAAQLGWESDELGLRLFTDFMQKFDRGRNRLGRR